MNEEQKERCKVRLQMLFKTINEDSTANILKKTMKKKNFDNFYQELNLISEDSQLNDKNHIISILNSLKNMILTSNNESQTLLHSIKRLEQILEQFPSITNTELQMNTIEECKTCYSQLLDLTEQCNEKPINKDIIKQINDKYIQFQVSMKEAWESLNVKVMPQKAQITASIKNAEKSLETLSIVSDVIYLIDTVLLCLNEENQQKDLQQNKKTQTNKNTKQKGKRKQTKQKKIEKEESEEKLPIIQHDFVDFFKKKTFTEVCKMREIPEQRARESEIEFMENRRKTLKFSYDAMKSTYMPSKQIEAEEIENQRLKELYRASLLSKEDFANLVTENEELKQAIAELEDFYGQYQKEQQEKQSKNGEIKKVILRDENTENETNTVEEQTNRVVEEESKTPTRTTKSRKKKSR